jgi:hypothetical protein
MIAREGNKPLELQDSGFVILCNTTWIEVEWVDVFGAGIIKAKER